VKWDRSVREGKIIDLFGGVMISEPLARGEICRKEEFAIRRILRLGKYEKFPKCKHKNHAKVKELDTALGFSKEEIRLGKGFHSRKNHIACEECLCGQVAGAGTRGWWYWPIDNDAGLGEVGHYGVGPCFFHGPFNKIKYGGIAMKGYTRMIDTEIKALQQKSLSPLGVENQLIDISKEAELTRATNHIREMVLRAQADADQIVKKLESGEGYTELYRGEPVPASDDTVFKMKLRYIEAIAKISKMDFDVGRENFASKGEVNMLFQNILMELEMNVRPFISAEQWVELMKGMTQVSNNVKYG